MPEMMKADAASMAAGNPAWLLGFGGIEATQQLLRRSEAAAKVMAELNSELIGFANQRSARIGEMAGRLAQCQSVPELLDTESQWLQRTLQDYSEEAGRLLDVNLKLFGCFLPEQPQSQPPPVVERVAPRQAA